MKENLPSLFDILPSECKVQEDKADKAILKKCLFKTTSCQNDTGNVNSSNENGAKNNFSSSETRQGRWAFNEHLRFIKACLLYGNNWKEVKKYVKTRSSSQLRSHAQKYLIKLNKKYNNNPTNEQENNNKGVGLKKKKSNLIMSDNDDMNAGKFP